MNEHRSEKFGRQPRRSRHNQQPQCAASANTERAEVLLVPPKLNPKIFEYTKLVLVGKTRSSWLNRSELPSEEEVLDMENSNESNPSVVEILPNKPVGPWDSKGTFPLSLPFKDSD